MITAIKNIKDLCLQLTKKDSSPRFYDFVLTYHTLELQWIAAINVYLPDKWSTEFCKAIADTPEEAIRVLMKSNEIVRKLTGSSSINCVTKYPSTNSYYRVERVTYKRASSDK